MTSALMPSPKALYGFTAGHSLLMGLAPFFIAIIVFNQQHSMSDVCALLSVSGLAFLPAIVLFESLRADKKYTIIVTLSFVFLLGMMGILVLDQSLQLLYPLGIINGFYLCFYWLSIRISLAPFTYFDHAGRIFGNFQMVSGAFMKAGILLGGVLFTYHYAQSILLIAGIIILGLAYPLLTHTATNKMLAIPQQATSPLAWQDFKTIPHSHKFIFLCDGIFLYMESYFWIITLYMLVNQQFYRLSMVILLTALILLVSFLLLKNRIDVVNGSRLYRITVLLYAVSWFLRAYIPHLGSSIGQYLSIIIIAFFTYGFRLSFNQLFFTYSQHCVNSYAYIVGKSLYSQMAIAVFFFFLAMVTATVQNNANMGYRLYFYAGFSALLYGFYAFKSAEQK